MKYMEYRFEINGKVSLEMLGKILSKKEINCLCKAVRNDINTVAEFFSDSDIAGDFDSMTLKNALLDTDCLYISFIYVYEFESIGRIPNPDDILENLNTGCIRIDKKHYKLDIGDCKHIACI